MNQYVKDLSKMTFLIMHSNQKGNTDIIWMRLEEEPLLLSWGAFVLCEF